MKVNMKRLTSDNNALAVRLPSNKLLCIYKNICGVQKYPAENSNILV